MSGSLSGTALVAFFSISLLFLTWTQGRCSIPKLPGYAFLVVYSMYMIYEVCASYEWMRPICFGSICL